MLCIQGDVREPGDLRRAVDQVVSTFGSLHVLVNNAGIGLYSKAEEIPRADLEDVFATNVFGPVYAVQAALPQLRKVRGQVINITSVLARASIPLSSSYCMSKHALHAFTVALRIEMIPYGIDVLEVAPGVTETSFNRRSRVFGFEGVPSLNEGGSAASPESVAEAVLRASRKAQPETLLTFKGKALIAAQWLFPRITERILSRKMLAVMERYGGKTESPVHGPPPRP
jgi:NAD(P)-dependent dehydrogenase (short-subunit alcohol dehydrogenase family)